MRLHGLVQRSTIYGLITDTRSSNAQIAVMANDDQGGFKPGVDAKKPRTLLFSACINCKSLDM